jgi:hypothetical protein
MNARGGIDSRQSGGGELQQLQSLFGSGVKLCALVAPRAPRFDLAAISGNIAFAASELGSAHLCGIESANEFNAPSLAAPDWAMQLRQFQAWLYEAVRANRGLNGVPVVGPSIWNRVTVDVLALGNLEPYLDASNLHYYTGGLRPTIALKRGGGQDSLADAVREARTQGPSKALYVTEFGYMIAPPSEVPSSVAVSEAAGAKYLLRGLFDLFAAGAEKTFVYSLIDDVQRARPTYYGLLDGSLNRRKSFYAIANLMKLMRDSGAPFTVRPLGLTIEAPPSVKSMLFQKSDGSYLLILYQDVDSYDLDRRRDIEVAPVPVTIALPARAASVEVFAPTTDLAVRQRASSAQKLIVPVPDEVTAVSIRA